MQFFAQPSCIVRFGPKLVDSARLPIMWASQIFGVSDAAVKILWQKCCAANLCVFFGFARESEREAGDRETYSSSCISKYLWGVWQSPTWRLGQIASVDDVFTAAWITCDKLFFWCRSELGQSVASTVAPAARLSSCDGIFPCLFLMRRIS